MELCIATDYAGETPVIEELEEELKLIAASGFTHIHWCNEWDGDYIYSVHEMKQIKEWFDKYGLKAKSLHATKGSAQSSDKMDAHYRKDYTSTIEYNRLAGVELVKNRVDMAAYLGASEIVLHTVLPCARFEQDPSYKEVFYTQVFRSLDELQPYCMEQGVRICIENLFANPRQLEMGEFGPVFERFPADQIEEFERLFERYPAEFLGMCLDSGHGHLVWGNDFITELAERYKDRIFSVHLHDNLGWKPIPGGRDAHRIPGEGGIDWPTFMKVLADSAYELPLTMELVTHAAKEEIPQFLRDAYNAGAKLMEWYRQ